MINGIHIVSVWVLDQDCAKEFYTTKLGFELTNDIKLDNGMRWMTVRPPGSTGQEFVLMDPSHSMLDEQTAEQVRALVAKGALSLASWPRPTAAATMRCSASGVSSSPRRLPSGLTGSRRSCGTTRETGSASPSDPCEGPRPGRRDNRLTYM